MMHILKFQFCKIEGEHKSNKAYFEVNLINASTGYQLINNMSISIVGDMERQLGRLRREANFEK